MLKECLWGSDNGHLWFLPTLFLMFMLTLVLITICGTGARLDIVMAVIGVIALGLYGTARQTVSWNTYLLQFSNYYLFFALGFIYHRNERLLHKQLRHTTVPIIPKPLAAIVLAGAMAAAWFKPATPILLLCSCLSVLAVYIITPQHSTPFMRFISKDSMGIYLFHSPMLYISFTFWPDINPPAHDPHQLHRIWQHSHRDDRTDEASSPRIHHRRIRIMWVRFQQPPPHTISVYLRYSATTSNLSRNPEKS